jgi:hypothetical protein
MLAFAATLALGIQMPVSGRGVLVSGRPVTASALRGVSVLDTSGAARSVDELVGKKGVLVYLRHMG